jgi:hypothetical protein
MKIKLLAYYAQNPNVNYLAENYTVINDQLGERGDGVITCVKCFVHAETRMFRCKKDLRAMSVCDCWKPVRGHRHDVTCRFTASDLDEVVYWMTSRFKHKAGQL